MPDTTDEATDGSEVGDASGDEVVEDVAEADGREASDTRRRRWRTRAAWGLGAATIAFLLAVLITNVVVTSSATGLAFDEVADVPQRPVAIVFGAGLVDGKPSPALADRVHGAVRLYQQGRVTHLLMTGDNSVVTYDEVTAMKDQAMAEGVPGAAITRDYAGFNTYDSCYRARAIFGVQAAVLVTQDYHLPRALYTCRELGIDAVGLIVPDWQHHPEQATAQYPRLQSTSYMAREWFARSKEVLAAKVTHPQPSILGPYEGLRET